VVKRGEARAGRNGAGAFRPMGKAAMILCRWRLTALGILARWQIGGISVAGLDRTSGARP
jgi:hypothetical protein